MHIHICIYSMMHSLCITIVHMHPPTISWTWQFSIWLINIISCSLPSSNPITTPHCVRVRVCDYYYYYYIICHCHHTVLMANGKALFISRSPASISNCDGARASNPTCRFHTDIIDVYPDLNHRLNRNAADAIRPTRTHIYILHIQ